MCAGVISSVEMSSRSLGFFSGWRVSQGRSSPASCRLMSAGSSVRNRILPVSFTRSGRLRISRLSRGFATDKFYSLPAAGCQLPARKTHHGLSRISRICLELAAKQFAAKNEAVILNEGGLPRVRSSAENPSRRILVLFELSPNLHDALAVVCRIIRLS